ncbi:hypothetical protein BKA70DRAFT_1343926 [Coprinopsis sp. MPI-PUGE-AT-0042]|nr:hypothetical protein BKA70DRAFT_1343926 [Coprinopsis sp. MPI-PUGE-AT-0042]
MASTRSRRGRRSKKMARICPNPQSSSSLSWSVPFRPNVSSMSIIKTMLMAKSMANPRKAGAASNCAEVGSDDPKRAARAQTALPLRCQRLYRDGGSSRDLLCSAFLRLAWVTARIHEIPRDTQRQAMQCQATYKPRNIHIGTTKLSPGISRTQ